MFDKSDIAQPSTHWSLAFYSNRSFTVDTDANNELITDGEFVQPLTAVEIEALKKSGAKATVCLVFRYELRQLSRVSFDCIQDIIKAQIEQHANYELKTEYSKDKYIKRKEAKQVLIPSIPWEPSAEAQ